METKEYTFLLQKLFDPDNTIVKNVKSNAFLYDACYCYWQVSFSLYNKRNMDISFN